MRVLGIDIGIRTTNPAAIALLEFDELTPTLLTYADVKPEPALGLDWRARAASVGDKLGVIIEASRAPGLVVAYEYPHLERDPQVLRKLAAVEGMILLEVFRHLIEVVAVDPTQAKVALTSNARAKPDAMRERARAVFGQPGIDEHIAAAIGVALYAESVVRRRLRLRGAA